MLRAFGWKKETECLNLGVDSFPGAFPVQGLWTSSQNYSFVNGNVDFDFDTNEIRSEHDQLERATLFNAELVVDPELASASVVDIKAEERAQCKRQVRTALVLFLVIGLLVTIIATPIQLTKSKPSLVETPSPTDSELLTSLTTSFSGILPTEYFRLLTSLTYLDLHSTTSPTQTLPTEIGLLTNLNYLDLSSNTFTGTLPTEIGLITSLTSLYVHIAP